MPSGADNQRRAKQRDAVDQPVVKKRARRVRPALDQNGRHALRAEIFEQFRQGDAAVKRLGGQKPHAERLQRGLARRIGLLAGGDQHRHLAGRPRQLRLRRQARLAVEHDARSASALRGPAGGR